MGEALVLRKLGIQIVLVSVLLGCGPSLSLVKSRFYDFQHVTTELVRLRSAHPDIVHVQVLGKTFEGRPILAVRLRGNKPSPQPRPAILAIFTEHGDEHDVTNLGIGILRELAARYGTDDEVTRLLDETVLWVVPMMNPDGADYALSGEVKPLTWRKNRRPTGKQTYGVDLNRNWGRVWDAPVPKELAEDLSDPRSDVYAGEHPFSEAETRAIRDFLLAHPQVRLFADYHSGGAFFLQGGVGYPIPPDGFDDPCFQAGIERLAEGLAAAISNTSDSRPAFIVSKERDVAPLIRKHAPWYIKAFIPRSIPAPPGVSGEWVYGKMGIPALGVEIMRDSDFFSRLPKSMDELIEAHTRGFVQLLTALSQDVFRCEPLNKD